MLLLPRERPSRFPSTKLRELMISVPTQVLVKCPDCGWVAGVNADCPLCAAVREGRRTKSGPRQRVGTNGTGTGRVSRGTLELIPTDGTT